MGPYRVPRRDLFEYAVTYYAGCVIFLYKGLFKNQNNILLETLPEARKTDIQQVEVHWREEGGEQCA